MTTIIIVVVVALVFFVTVCVVTFMVWKRETEMRTDSIRAIENNLERLGDRLMVEPPSEEKPDMQEGLCEEARRQAVTKPVEHVAADKLRRTESRDPFSWIRSDQEAEAILPEETLQQTEDGAQPEPLQQTEQPPVMPEIPAASPQTVPEAEAFAEPAGIQSRREAETGQSAADDFAESPDWDDVMDFEVDLPDADALAEAAADDIASMEIELPDLDLFTGLGNLDVNTEGTEYADPPRQFGRDIGRSGKKYTAEELEMLIKE